MVPKSVQEGSTETVTTRAIAFPPFPVRTNFDLQQEWPAGRASEAAIYGAILRK
jgi:hypothetical protein